MIKNGLSFLVAFSLLILLNSTIAKAQSKGDSMVKKGDSVQVYIDMDDFQALKASETGSKAKIKVLGNVMKFNEKIVNKNDAVFCTVLKRSRGGAYGGGGKLIINIDSTYSTGKSMVPLRGTYTMKGHGSLPKTVFSVILFPIGWLIKGGDIKFPEDGKNLTFPVLVKEDTPVKYQR